MAEVTSSDKRSVSYDHKKFWSTGPHTLVTGAKKYVMCVLRIELEGLALVFFFFSFLCQMALPTERGRPPPIPHISRFFASNLVPWRLSWSALKEILKRLQAALTQAILKSRLHGDDAFSNADFLCCAVLVLYPRCLDIILYHLRIYRRKKSDTEIVTWSFYCHPCGLFSPILLNRVQHRGPTL